VIKEEAFSTLR